MRRERKERRKGESKLKNDLGRACTQAFKAHPSRGGADPAERGGGGFIAACADKGGVIAGQWASAAEQGGLCEVDAAVAQYLLEGGVNQVVTSQRGAAGLPTVTGERLVLAREDVLRWMMSPHPLAFSLFFVSFFKCARCRDASPSPCIGWPFLNPPVAENKGVRLVSAEALSSPGGITELLIHSDGQVEIHGSVGEGDMEVAFTLDAPGGEGKGDRYVGRIVQEKVVRARVRGGGGYLLSRVTSMEVLEEASELEVEEMFGSAAQM